MALPTFVYTPEVKTGNEIQIYYNLGVGRVKKRKYYGGEVDNQSCAGNPSCPAGSFDATVLTSVVNSDGLQLAFGSIPAQAPLFTAAEGDHAPANSGVNADLVCLPDPANDVLICFDRSFSASLGSTFKPVPRKFSSADHYIRQRGDNTITMSDLFIANRVGLQAIRGRRVTIIAKIYPQGGGSLQGAIYFSNVVLNLPPIAYSTDGNAEMEISAEGSFEFCAVFGATPV